MITCVCTHGRVCVYVCVCVNPMQALPSHLPPSFSLGWAFSRCLDLAGGPQRKSVLRALAEACSNPDEKRTLIYLTTRAGERTFTSCALQLADYVRSA